MHVFLAVGRLCLRNWKKVIAWALYGLLLPVLYGVGSGMPDAAGLAALFVVGATFGIFVGVLVQVNESRGKKNQSLKPIDRDVRNLSERELHIAFSIIGSLIGILVAGMFALPLLGYAISVALFIMIGLSRKSLDKILP
jgi:hypothetical protein